MNRQQKLIHNRRYEGCRNAIAALITKARSEGAKVRFVHSDSESYQGTYLSSHPCKIGIFVWTGDRKRS